MVSQACLGERFTKHEEDSPRTGQWPPGFPEGQGEAVQWKEHERHSQRRVWPCRGGRDDQIIHINSPEGQLEPTGLR